MRRRKGPMRARQAPFDGARQGCRSPVEARPRCDAAGLVSRGWGPLVDVVVGSPLMHVEEPSVTRDAEGILGPLLKI
eukprot:1991845-Pleurochrysis_carterae.AAC.1